MFRSPLIQIVALSSLVSSIVSAIPVVDPSRPARNGFVRLSEAEEDACYAKYTGNVPDWLQTGSGGDWRQALPGDAEWVLRTPL